MRGTQARSVIHSSRGTMRSEQQISQRQTRDRMQVATIERMILARMDMVRGG